METSGGLGIKTLRTMSFNCNCDEFDKGERVMYEQDGHCLVPIWSKGQRGGVPGDDGGSLEERGPQGSSGPIGDAPGPGRLPEGTVSR